jgi:hypothetical protein
MMNLKVRILKAFAGAFIITGIAVLTSCEKYAWAPPVIPGDIVVSYSEHLYPECHNCHTSWNIDKTYNELSSHVDTVNPESSEILNIHGSIYETTMVQVNDTLTIPLSDAVIIWASQGAKYNK